MTNYEAEGCDPGLYECAEGRHHEVCPARAFAPDHYTKGEFVAGAQANTEASISDFLFWLDEGYSREDAVEATVDGARESAVCFAGIGSCGMGWCHHS